MMRLTPERLIGRQCLHFVITDRHRAFPKRAQTSGVAELMNKAEIEKGR